MRRRRIALGGAGLVLATLVLCVWLVPGMLDWNRYRDGIAALATQRLGRPVHIGGAVGLQLLPQPILTASDVAIEDAGDGVVLQARALRLRVALGSLMAGQVDARELTLQGADLRLPWPPPAGALAQRPPAWITGLQARVEQGRLQVGGLVLTNMDATLSTDPDTGTLSAAGVGQAGGGPGEAGSARNWQFTARLARPGRDGSAGLDLSLDGLGPLRDTGGTFSGQIGADGALAGRVAGRGPDLSQLMPAPALPWRGDGRLSAAAGLAVADELALEIGGAPARGAVALRVTPEARLDLAIAAGRLDLDAWLPALLGRVQPGAPASLRAALPTGIDLSAEAATLAGGTVRRLRGAVDLDQGAITLRDVSAVLPGEATLALSGQVATQAPRFEGAARLIAPDLRGTLRWLQRLLPPVLGTVPGGVLRTADLSAQVVAGPGQYAVTDLHGTLDGSRINGSASIRAAPQTGRSAIAAGLVLDTLALGPWLPAPADAGPGDAAPFLAGLRGVDADVRLQAGRVDWGGVPLGAVTVELQTEASRVFLRRLDVQPLGMRLSISGQISDAGRLSDGRLDVTAPDLGVLAPAVTERWPDARALHALLRGPGSLAVQAAGGAEALSGRVTLEASDLRLEAQPVINVPGRRGSGSVTLHHPGAPRLLEVLGLGGTAAWLGDGSLSLVGQLAVGPGRVELEGATLAAGALRATGRVALDGTRLTGQVAAEALPLPLVYPRSPDPLPLAGLRGWQAAVRLEATQVLVGLTPVLRGAAAELTLEAGVLRLARVTGRVAGGTVSGSVTIDAAPDLPRVSVTGQAKGLDIPAGVFEAPVDLLAGQVEANVELAAAGFSPAALLATLGGTATIRVRDGAVSGFDLGAIGAALGVAAPAEAIELARAALLSGTTAFTTIEAPLRIERGIVSTDARLTGPAGEGQLAGSFELRGGALDLRLTVRPPVDGVPALGVRLSGVAGEPVRTPELAGLARWLADRPLP